MAKEWKNLYRSKGKVNAVEKSVVQGWGEESITTQQQKGRDGRSETRNVQDAEPPEVAREGIQGRKQAGLIRMVRAQKVLKKKIDQNGGPKDTRKGKTKKGRESGAPRN